MEDIKNLDGLELFLGYKCNVKCDFCFQKYARKEYIDSFSKNEVIFLIKKWYLDWKRFIIFSGWEPTLDRNLAFYIEFSKKIWYKYIRVHTNWFMFKDKEYLENLYRKWLSGVTISIHWYDNIHDNVVWVKWSFWIIRKALDNFENLIKKDNSFVVDINTVIYKWNYDKLLKMFLFLFKYTIVRYQINYSSSLDSFKKEEKDILLVRYNKIIWYLKNILLLSIKYNKKIVLDSIPYCIIGEKFSYFLDNNIKNDRESISTNWDNEKSYNETYNNIKTDKCIGCEKYNICRWIPLDYYEVFWDEDIKIILWKKIY